MLWFLFRRRMLSNRLSRMNRNLFYLIILLIPILFIWYLFTPTPTKSILSSTEKTIEILQRKDYNTTAMKPIIFIGGMPRSGTTLMRAVLDSHPLVRCGEETRVIPRILSMRAAWKKSPVEWNRLMAGGMTESILDSAVRAFVYEILVHHSQSADILCDKDPFVLKYAAYTSSIFPHSKFLFLIRDARAVIHSVMTRKVTITGFSLTDYRQNFKLWNKGIEIMYGQCQQVGSKQCMMVYYEQLVLQPKKTIENILEFLNIPWNDNVLHHEELIGKKISLSKVEYSSDQVIKPINLEALTKWIGCIPPDVLLDLDNLAPMLRILGYDTQSAIPSYGAADQLVLDNTNRIRENEEFWNIKTKLYARQSSNATNSFRSHPLF